MNRVHTTLQKLLPDYAEQVKGVYGDALISLIIYGSAVGPGYHPDRSDVNIMLILADTGVSRLRAYSPVFEHWRKHRFNAPLFATKDYLRSSADVFPLEFLDIKERHLLLAGEEVMTGLEIDMSNLRYQCEEQVKGQLVRLRGALIEAEWEKDRTEKLLVMALSSLLPVFRGILRLLRLECPLDGNDVINRICASLEIRGEALQTVRLIRTGERYSGTVHDLSGDFLAAVGQIAERLDHLKASGRL